MKQVLAILLGLSAIHVATASSTFERHTSPFFSVSLLTPLSLANTQSLQLNNNSGFPAPANADRYTVSHSAGSPGLSVAAGYQWSRDNTWLPALLLSARYQYLYQHALNGDIWQFNQPNMQNYDYQMQLATHSLMAYAKAIIQQKHNIAPFVSLALGGESNHLYRYTELARTGITPRVSPGFANKHNTHASYAAGFGVDIKANKNMSLSFSYEYHGQTKLRSGNGQANWSSSHLNFGKLHNQLLAISFNYQLDTSN